MTVWNVASEMPNRKQDYLYFAKGIDFNHESMRPDLNLRKKKCHPPNIPWVMEKNTPRLQCSMGWTLLLAEWLSGNICG